MPICPDCEADPCTCQEVSPAEAEELGKALSDEEIAEVERIRALRDWIPGNPSPN